MIQPRELRIGNCVRSYPKNDLIFTVKCLNETFAELEHIDKDGTIYNTSVDYKDLIQIPITEEILLKFGFYEIYKSEFSIRYGIENFDEIEFKWNKTFGWNFYYKTFCIEGIKFVHSLQTLFFSLCGEELKFEDIS